MFKQWYAYGNYIDEVLAKGTTPWPVSAMFYIHDHLYSPAALTNFWGTVLERYEYDAYGSPTIWNADFTTERDSSNYGNPYLFTGRRVDILDSGSLKIQYNRNRYYDYYSGRWLSHDPLGVTPNAQWPNIFNMIEQYKYGPSLYEYVRSEPTILLDPYGLLDCWVDESGILHYTPHDPSEPPIIRYCGKWKNDGNATYKLKESGCHVVGTPTLPLAPGCGPILAVIGICVELTQPTHIVCNSVMNRSATVPGQICECKFFAKRSCKRTCCELLSNKSVTEKMTIEMAFYTYGKAYHKFPTMDRWNLRCSCDKPNTWQLNWLLNCNRPGSKF